MIGLDCNILVHLALADHPVQASSVAAIKEENNNGIKVAFPPLIATEFLHVVTDVRRFSPALSMAAAVNWLETFLLDDRVVLLHPTDAAMTLTIRWMSQFQ